MQSGAINKAEELSDQFYVLAETIPQLAWMAGADGRDEYFNQRWYDYTQSTPEQALGEGWLNFVHPDDRPYAQEAWDTAVRTSQPYEAKFRLRNGRTGQYQWFLERGMPLTDSHRHVLKWFGTYTNIDEQKRIEEALRQSRDAFRLLIEALPQLVWIAQPDGKQEYANQRWYTYMGRSAEQVVGNSWISNYHPDDQHKILTLWHASLLTSQPFEAEARIREGKTEEYRWFLIRGVPLLNAYDRVWRWLGTNTDIHEQKRTEEALKESEVRFRHFMQSNLLGMMISDLEGKVYEANDALLSLLGYTREDLAAGRLDWVRMTPPEYRAQDIQALEEERATGTFTPYEKEFFTKDGRRVPVLVGGTLFRRDSTSQMEICFVLDLTARKEIERQSSTSE